MPSRPPSPCAHPTDGPALGFLQGQQLLKVTAADGASNDQFGYAVAISSDGTRVAVGSPLGDSLEASWALLGLSWGTLGALLGLSWGPLGGLGGNLGGLWGSLGPSWGSLGAFLGALGAPPSEADQSVPGALVGRSWSLLGPSWCSHEPVLGLS